MKTVRSETEKDESQFKEGIFVIERRKCPRFVVELPFDYSCVDAREENGGIATNVSEGGLLVYLPDVIKKGALLKIVILFMKGSELNTIKGIAKVVWCDLAAKAAWGEHRYGLEFLSFNKGSLEKLKILLKEVAETHTG
jgi:c-di-GMP-binding flagellar brake protein YcgR